MARFSSVEVVPRKGSVLVVGLVCRISGCSRQKEVSLEDQTEHGKEVVELLWAGEVDYLPPLATKAKGERLDRPELASLEEWLRSGKLDLLVVEDLGRLVRGPEAVRLLGIGVDYGVRSLSPNDGIDTADPNWEEIALAACAEHVRHNSQTSMRVKQKTMRRFTKEDGAFQRPIAGYDVPKGATTWSAWRKRDADTQVIKDGAELLFQELNGQFVADFFNETQFQVGPYARRKKKQEEKKWDGALVLLFYRNTLLSGRPMRGRMHTKKHFESGRRISVINPRGPRYLDRPHLAHLDPVWHDELITRLNAVNANVGHPEVNRVHRLTGVHRCDSRCPGRHARCWYCGREYVWGANGITGNLMCNGSRQRHCWNSIGFDGALAARRLTEVIGQELSVLDGIDAQYSAIVQSVLASGSDGLADRRHKLEKDEAQLAGERQKVKETILKCGPSDLTAELLQELNERSRRLTLERRELEELAITRPNLPASVPDLRSSIESTVGALSRDSYQFGKLMRLLAPEFHVFLVRLSDGGRLFPRARVKLNLAGSVLDVGQVPGLVELLNRVLIIDLFKQPPCRERLRRESVRLARENPTWTYDEIARHLPEIVSGTSVGHALTFEHHLQALGLSDPYVLVTEPPKDLAKVRRHKNPKYRFEPLEGYEPPTL